jgi:hypothetical protein
VKYYLVSLHHLPLIDKFRREEPASLFVGLLWQGLGSWAGFGASAPFAFGAAMSLLAGILFWRLVKA